MKKQTAVEWLVEQLTSIGQLEVPMGSNAVTSVIEQAKQIEKEQIIDAYNEGLTFDWEEFEKTAQDDISEAEQYYNKTFKSE